MAAETQRQSGRGRVEQKDAGWLDSNTCAIVQLFQPSSACQQHAGFWLASALEYQIISGHPPVNFVLGLVSNYYFGDGLGTFLAADGKLDQYGAG